MKAKLLRNLRNPVTVKEHGAWAILLIPMLSGVLQAKIFSFPALLLSMSITAFFLSYRPYEIWHAAKPGALNALKKENALFWLIAYAGIGAVTGLWLLVIVQLWRLLLLGVAAALLFGIATAIGERKKLSQLREILGIAALTLGAPAMYLVCTGELSPEAMKLWIGNTLFFMSSSFFVHLKISEMASGKNDFARKEHRNNVIENIAYQTALLLLLFVLYKNYIISAYALLAFLPMIIHCLGGSRKTYGTINFKKIGILFSVYSLYFGILAAL